MRTTRARNELIIRRVKVKLFLMEKYFRKFRHLHEMLRMKKDFAITHYARKLQFKALKSIWVDTTNTSQ